MRRQWAASWGCERSSPVGSLSGATALLIGVELVDARDNNQIWGEHYNRKLSDIFAVQQEISKEISEKLRLRLTGEDQKRLTKTYTENTEAYQLYLKGRFYWNKFTARRVPQEHRIFQAGGRKGSEYGLAYSGLADSYILLGRVAPRNPKRSFRKRGLTQSKALAAG